MPTSRQELALAALYASLQGLAGVTVARGADGDFDETELPAINQRDGTDEILDAGTGLEIHETDVSIEIYTTDATTEANEQAASDLQARAWQAAKSAEADPSVFLIIFGTGSREADDTEGLAPFLSSVLQVGVRFTTAEGDPYSAPA